MLWKAEEGIRKPRRTGGFGWCLPDGQTESAESMAHNALSQGVPKPGGELVFKSRTAFAVRAAARATHTTGMSCKFMPPETPYIEAETMLRFQWEHVLTRDGRDHIVSISYHHLFHHARAIPRCPLGVGGEPGFRYSLEFLDAFAKERHVSLVYAGISYEGPVNEVVRDLP